MSDLVPDRETVRKAIALATRAPSVHNTQPWRWVIGDGSLRLFADWERHAPVTDPDGRDLVISCGAALHHLRIAFAALGWTTVVRRLPDPVDPTLLASVEIRGPHEPSTDDIWLARMMQRRRTDRRRYSSWPVPPGHLEDLTTAAAGEGGLAVTVTDPAARFQLAGAIAQAAVLQESNPDYRVEMAIWSGRSRGSDDGVLAASILNPAEAPTELRQRTFAQGTLTQPSGKRYGELASLLVIATSSDDLLSRLRAGEAASAALLHATRLGMATCPLSQPLEIADTRRTIQDDVLHGTAVPQLLLRLGWASPSADPLPQSPRRDLDDVISGL